MTKITITSGTELTNKDMKNIESYLKEKYADFVVNYVVENSLIGGIVIFDGEKIYDASLQGQLNRLVEDIKNKK